MGFQLACIERLLQCDYASIAAFSYHRIVQHLMSSAAGSLPCKICGTSSPFYGTVDFNRHCLVGRICLADSGIPIRYNRCPNCGFLFTAALDAWGPDKFRDAIYNDDYILVDPDYAETRPVANAEFLTTLFGPVRESLTVLDYGGGSGLLADTLVKNGFLGAETYDPFNPRFAHLSGKRFHIVTCFETLEHVPDPRHEIATIAGCVKDDGMVVFSTLIQPEDFEQIGLSWWYLAPRNGHISLFTRKALAAVWRLEGFRAISLSDNIHFAFRKIPSFAQKQLTSK